MNIFYEAKSILTKSGKVNPLGPYGKSKLTTREISTYFRRNPVRDVEVRKAVEVALDLEGAYDIAVKEIKKFYGDKILKSKEVQNALRYANESVIENGQIINENYRKLAQYGMGTETSKSARVGLELDFYDEKGNKQFGKILRKTNDGYLVKDDKGKKHVFKYHDRVKAKKMLKPNYVHTEDLNLNEKSSSEAQQKLMGMALAYKRGEMKDASPKVKELAKSMSEKDLEDFAKTKHDEVPAKVKESVMDAYRKMWEDATQLDEEVANITVDPKNRISKSADQNKHSNEIVKQARRFGLKASQMGKHVRIKGAKKAVNDFLRIIIGKSSYGDPTEKDMSTPQIDKMLTKSLK